MKAPAAAAFVLLLALLSVHATAQTAAEKPAGKETSVAMDAVQVGPGFPHHGLSFKYNRDRQRPPAEWPIREIRITVRKGSERGNDWLKSGDLLLAINGKTVIGLTSPQYTEFVRLIDAARATGEPRRYVYTVKRGSITREIPVTIPSS